MADLAFPRTPVRDVASWRNQIRQSLKNIAGQVRENQLGPAAAADRIDRWSVGHSGQVTRHSRSIVAILREAPTTPDPGLVAQARRLLKHYAPAAKQAARDRAPWPEPTPAPPKPAARPAEPADLAGEVVGLDQAIGYASGLATFAGEHTPAGNEGYLGRLAGAEVTGDGLASGQAMQDAFAAAGAAATAHTAELIKQKTVQQAYDQDPDAGDKSYLAGTR